MTDEAGSILYPRIPIARAQHLANEYRHLPIQVLNQQASIADPMSFFSPTGGSRSTSEHLKEIAENIRRIAKDHGYPSNVQRRPYSQFDAVTAEYLHSNLRITASEASSAEIWAFVACVLLPDVVRWRFFSGGKPTSLERFLGGGRGLRNTFGRLWWRAEVLSSDIASSRYEYVFALTEDQLVQLMERPSVSGNPELAREFCEFFLSFRDSYAGVSRDDLMREATKRLRRMMAINSLDLLSREERSPILQSVFVHAAKGIQAAAR